MFSLKKIFELIAGTSLNDAHEFPVSEGVEAGKTKKYTIAQLKQHIWLFIETQIANITKGDKGDTGATGAQGIQGPQGLQGLRGDIGPQGLKGDVGPQGPMGIQGPIGEKGEKGDTGEQGVQGIQGEKGEQGDPGNDAQLPVGGLTGQVLGKVSNNDGDVNWIDGASSFADLAGNPMDNTALADDLNRIEAKADVAKNDIDALEIIVSNKLDKTTKATTAETNTGTDNTKYLTPQNLQGSKYLDLSFSKIAGTTTGTGSAYLLSLTPALTSYTTNQIIIIQFHVTNLTGASLNIDNLGARTLIRMDGSGIVANELVANIKYLFIYNGTSFQLIGGLSTSNYILNQSAFQTANFSITGTGRVDGGLGLGINPDTTKSLGIAANTPSKAQMLLTPSAIDYTGSVNGMLWNNAGEIKFLDNGFINRLLKLYNNALLSGSGSRILEVNQYGDLSAVSPIIEHFALDIDITIAITSATYTGNRAIVTPANGKVFYQGQMYDDGTYTYLAIDDNKVKRF